MASRRRSLTEVLEETRALKASRTRARKRVARAKLEANAPQIPDAAIRAYSGVMSTYAERVRKAVEQHVIGALPVVGSGDDLDRAALERGLELLQADLDKLAGGVRRSARAAAERTSMHARREIGRILRMEVPPSPSSRFTVSRFEDMQVRRLQKVGRDQVAQIRKAIAEYREGDSMREDILHSLWVSRNRGQVVAKSECMNLHRETIQEWAVVAGSEGGYYVTARDERVRPHHFQHEGKYFRWGETPATLHEPSCRCRIVPGEAPGLK